MPLPRSFERADCDADDDDAEPRLRLIPRAHASNDDDDEREPSSRADAYDPCEPRLHGEQSRRATRALVAPPCADDDDAELYVLPSREKSGADELEPWSPCGDDGALASQPWRRSFADAGACAKSSYGCGVLLSSWPCFGFPLEQLRRGCPCRMGSFFWNHVGRIDELECTGR